MRQAKAIDFAIVTAALFDEGETDFSDDLTSQGGYSFDAIHPHFASVDAANTQMLRQAGLAVNPWTVDDPAEMKRLIQAGVSGIITDFPQILNQVTGGK
jgi:glycerophosphoryl diester phosphodiesterase